MYYVLSSELYHHGIKGQKWGIRRFQNEDGSLTTKGKKRYGEEGTESEKYKRDASRAKQKEQDRADKEKYLSDKSGIKKGIHSRAYDIGHNKSVGRIVAGTILKSAAIGTVSMVASERLQDAGHDGAALAIARIGTVSAASVTAVGMTAAVQRGRGKI